MHQCEVHFLFVCLFGNCFSFHIKVPKFRCDSLVCIVKASISQTDAGIQNLHNGIDAKFTQ